MAFDSKTAKAAARRRWEKHNAQPKYTDVNAPRMAAGNETVEIAAELPVGYNFLAGGIAKWEDPLLELSQTACVEMRRNYAIIKAHRKLAIRTSKVNWTMVGEGERAEAAAEIFGQIRGWADFIDHCTGSIYEGTRPHQIKQMPAREGSSEPWIVPDFWLGGRHRYNAGGDIEWDGADKLVQVQRSTGTATRQTKILPRDQFAIHRPGPGSNPEGYLDIGVALYNAVVKPSNRGVVSADLWMRLFAIPAILAGGNQDATRPEMLRTVFRTRAEAIQEAMGTGKAVGLSDDHVVQLLQANPQGLSGMVDYLRHLEGIADDVLTMGALLSSSGIGQAERTGNTETHAGEKDDAAFANAVAIAETFNRDVWPWIVKRNPWLPELADGEQEVYLWPMNPTENDEQDIDVESEGVGADDVGTDTEPVVQNAAQIPSVSLAAGDDLMVILDVTRAVLAGEMPLRAAKRLLKKSTSHDDDDITEIIDAIKEMMEKA